MNRNRTDKMGMQKKHDHESGFFEDNNLPEEKRMKRMIKHLTNHKNKSRQNIKTNNRQKRNFVDDKTTASTSAAKMRRTDDGPAQSERSHLNQKNSVKTSKEISKIVMDEQKCNNIISVSSSSSGEVILVQNSNSDSDRKKCSDESSSSSNHKNKKSRKEREEDDAYLRELEVASTIRNESEYSTYLFSFQSIKSKSLSYKQNPF